MMSGMSGTEIIQIEATPEFRQRMESEAARLNLSLSAYFLYLSMRSTPGQDAARLDRHVHDVFGRHGDLIRRLAK
jgi:hypothetical protein